MENSDNYRINSPLIIYNDKSVSCIAEEDPDYVTNEPIPASSLPANLGSLLDASFEEKTFEFENVNNKDNKTVLKNNIFDTSFQRANEINRKHSPSPLHISKASDSSEGDVNRDKHTGRAVESTVGKTSSRNPKPNNAPKRHPVLTTQVSFCQAPPIEHEYPPPAPRRHFSFGARTYAEQQRANSQHHTRRTRFSRQKTTR